MQHAHRTQQKIPHRLLTTNQLSVHKPPSPNMLAQQLLVAEAVAESLEWVALRCRFRHKGNRLTFRSVRFLNSAQTLADSFHLDQWETLDNRYSNHYSVHLASLTISWFMNTAVAFNPSEVPWRPESTSLPHDSTWHFNWEHTQNNHLLVSSLILYHTRIIRKNSNIVAHAVYKTVPNSLVSKVVNSTFLWAFSYVFTCSRISGEFLYPKHSEQWALVSTPKHLSSSVFYLQPRVHMSNKQCSPEHKYKCLRKVNQFLNIYSQIQTMWISGHHHGTNITGSFWSWPPEIAYKHTLERKLYNDAWS